MSNNRKLTIFDVIRDARLGAYDHPSRPAPGEELGRWSPVLETRFGTLFYGYWPDGKAFLTYEGKVGIGAGSNSRARILNAFAERFGLPLEIPACVVIVNGDRTGRYEAREDNQPFVKHVSKGWAEIGW